MTERMRIGGVPVDRLRQAEALDKVAELVRAGSGAAIYTPNVDHIVMATQDPAFHAVYQRADLALADGMPVLWASYLVGTPIPEKLSGSDFLIPLLARAAQEGWSVFLLGGGEGVATEAARRLQVQLPSLSIVGILSPFVNMAEPPETRRAIVDTLTAAAPALVLVALGAPKQEFLIDELRSRVPAVYLGIGASLDFIAGVTKRSPRWMSRSGLEWLYRLAQEPRRLAFRYLVRDPQFVAVLAKDLWRRRARGAEVGRRT